jgi:hypothetical protein
VTGGIAIAAIPVASGLARRNDAKLAADINAALKADSTIKIVNALTGYARRRLDEPHRKIS